jgi:hypothetical protein
MNPSNPAHDFDFWHGRWHIHNKRLVKRLQGGNDWETFEATATARPLPAGIGNYDDFVPKDWRPGFVGMSLRIYSPQTQLWSIYWLDNQTGGLDGGLLKPPVMGGFKDGVGIFEGDDVFEGKPIRVRFVWSDITPTSARWEQFFSPDGGQSWESNWVMEFSRAADPE